MKKLLLLFTIIFATNIFAKHCYTVQHKTLCYKRYFNISNIHNPILHTKYYKSKDGKVYSFEDNIEIRFKRIGAILTIEDDFEIKFIDKKQKETYLYKLINPDGLFRMITNLNQTSYIIKAVPIKHRKLTIGEKGIQEESKKVSMQRRLDNNN